MYRADRISGPRSHPAPPRAPAGSHLRPGAGAILASILLFTAAGCQTNDAAPGSGIVVDTLASGAIHVRNPETGLWTDNDRWRLEESVRIGRVDGQGPDVFGQIRGLAVDALGRVHVLDSQADEVRVFTPDGGHLRTLGGSGNGPGELSGPFGLGIDGSERIWVADSGNRRYTLWDSAGSLLGTHVRPLQGFSFTWTAGFDGERLLETSVVMGPEVSDWRPALFRLAFESPHTRVDTLLLPSEPSETYQLEENGMTRMSAIVPFTPSQTFTPGTDSHIWIGFSDRVRLHRVTFSGDTVLIIDREARRIPVTPMERDTALAMDFLQQMREAGAEVDPGRIPPVKPAYEWVMEDDEGHLWVGIPNAPDEEGSRMDVFDREGRYLGRVQVPDGISRWPLPVVRRGMLWAHVLDGFDVSHVVGYRIR